MCGRVERRYTPSASMPPQASLKPLFALIVSARSGSPAIFQSKLQFIATVNRRCHKQLADVDTFPRTANIPHPSGDGLLGRGPPLGTVLYAKIKPTAELRWCMATKQLQQS
ncbi:putative G-protein coupled receptor 113-like isoform X1 [Anopheles sinensis]|uniref:Putative G-protein coupled receptor 113-like isoform X1 n=1 Tax=Anopheles sinensis TaxID=74873 RepID=A0A084WPW5_ANOSI|nr:putative G-protein coupled receptor 113-like isoform X1 [Anopheles sinensis]